MFLTSRLLSAAAFAALAAAAAPALETTPAADAVIVTGLRTGTPASRLPAAVTVIEREDIELEGHVTLVQALERVPGAAVAQSGPAGSAASVFLRGANSKHALALYDGIRLNDPSAATGAFNFGADLLGDAQRIEIVRGPLSSLYGSDAVGGVINILPRQAPDAGYEAYGEAAAGSFNTARALAGAGYGGARLRVTANAEHLSTSGHNATPARMSTAGDERDGARFTAVSASAAYDLDDVLTLEALARWRRSSVEFDTFSGGPSGFQRADDPDLESRDANTLLSAGLAYRGPGGALEGRLRAGRMTNRLDAYDGGALTDAFDGRRSFVQWLNAWRPQNAPGLDAPVASFGAEWQNERARTDSAFGDPLDVSEQAWSVFTAGQAGLGGLLELTVSGRIDDFENFGRQTTANIGAVLPLEALGARLRASYGNSFKAPSLPERFASSAFITPNPDLEPETGRSLEIGFDAEAAFAHGGSLRYGATWHDGRIRNLIETEFDFTAFTGRNVNIGEADLSGYEVYGAFSPLPSLELSVDYAYTKAVNALDGQRLLRRPAHIWSAGAAWRVTPKLHASARWRRFGASRDVIYDDDGFFVSANGVLPGFDTLDLSASYDATGRVQLFASIRNVFNETYEQPAAFAGAPRALMAGVRVRP